MQTHECLRIISSLLCGVHRDPQNHDTIFYNNLGKCGSVLIFFTFHSQRSYKLFS